MNGPIRRVAVLSAAMVLVLLANITFLQTRAGDLNADAANRRVRDAEYSRARGAIMVGNTAVAYSQATTSSSFGYERVYADPALYAAVTGYYSYVYGSSGLEAAYNQELAGTSDSQALTRLVDTLTGKTQQGASIETTINAAAQKAAYDAMGTMTGAAVAIDYTTGAVLAYVSTPSYDPNQLSSTDIATEEKAWATLNSDAGTPLANRASSEIYPPGSTFKLVTTAAALEHGYTPDSILKSPAELQLPNSSKYLTNEDPCGGTEITMTQALDVSCNTAYANLGMSLGADTLQAQAEKFGFNSTINTDLPFAKSVFPTGIDQAQLAMSSIGQFDVAASPLQMAMVAATIANGGQGMEPYLVQEVRAADLQVLSSHAPTTMPRAISAKTASALQQMMVSVVTNGTGKAVQINGVTIGGKTGTAQSAVGRAPYAWFVCYSAQPTVAIAVFVQNADVANNEIAGGTLAAPVARAVIEALR